MSEPAQDLRHAGSEPPWDAALRTLLAPIFSDLDWDEVAAAVRRGSSLADALEAARRAARLG
jgi:hypothetical protein